MWGLCRGNFMCGVCVEVTSCVGFVCRSLHVWGLCGGNFMCGVCVGVTSCVGFVWG